MSVRRAVTVAIGVVAVLAACVALGGPSRTAGAGLIAGFALGYWGRALLVEGPPHPGPPREDRDA